MNVFRKIYCRAVMAGCYIIKPFLPYRIPKMLDGINDIPALLKEKQKNSVLLVTDKGLRSLGITSQLEEELKSAQINCVVYDATCANPTVANVEEALDLYKVNNCQAIIAFGGGSAIDCAKTVGARVAKPKKQVNQMGGLLRVRGKIPLLIAIPTTAGTGSEASPASVITDRQTGHKYTINDFCLSPHYAVLDPKVTFTLPPHLTATTGIDALTHSLEAFVGRSTSIKSRACSKESIKLVLDNIERAYSQGNDYEARANMLRASCLGGMAMSMAYVGYVHAVAHSLGGAYNLPHGLVVSVVLPVILEGYGKSVYKKLFKLAVHCGLADKKDSREAGAKKFIDKLNELYEKFNIPTTLDCIKKEDIPMMAKHADKEANLFYAVPRLWNAKDLQPFYEKLADWREKA